MVHTYVLIYSVGQANRRQLVSLATCSATSAISSSRRIQHLFEGIVLWIVLLLDIFDKDRVDLVTYIFPCINSIIPRWSCQSSNIIGKMGGLLLLLALCVCLQLRSVI